ncbi:MAG: hypothetical protein IKF90_01775 [Parasporobacterium sp.]|nr:hypothetical protein [Parasporobacterium sp.]
MFGYIVPNYKELSKEELIRYRTFYCGLCSSLRKNCGIAGRFSLTYDLTFLSILLSSLYMPSEHIAKERCLLHPLYRHFYIANKLVDYAADMNVLLVYHKLEDNILDDKSILAVQSEKVYRESFEQIVSVYPEKEKNLVYHLDALRKAESSDSFSLDAASNIFAAIMREVFLVYPSDRWNQDLGKMAEALGRFIYLLDAFDDYKKDVKKHRPTPFTKEPSVSEIKKMLDLHISECTQFFERLPLVQDVGLLRNILYSGVWTRYEMIRKRRNDKNGSL